MFVLILSSNERRKLDFWTLHRIYCAKLLIVAFNNWMVMLSAEESIVAFDDRTVAVYMRIRIGHFSMKTWKGVYLRV
jgi:hypothetical protein